MKANELRIGNLIQYFGKTETVIRVGKENSSWYVGCSDSLNDLMNCWNVEDAYEGTPLTEEWLLKFGFKQVDRFHVYFKEYGQVDFNVFSWETPVGQSNGVPAGEFYMIVNGVIVIINTVHQLQNLYFALTGTELELK